MKVSLSWLNAYVPVETDPESLAQALTMSGLEVEAVSNRYEYLDSVLVGRIVKITPHPNADKLRLCEVDIGTPQYLSVVCGAPNAAENMLAPLALPGTEFPNGLVLEKSVIRGQTSEGMLCSESELGLGTDKSGLMVLKDSLPAGEKLARALGLSDVSFEIGLTPNRADCLSVIGIAREVAAIQKKHITYPKTRISDTGDDISKVTSVTIQDPDHCPRYAARLIEDIKIAPSPFWLQDRLMSVGLRPISNIVDITNFVMMETGQPLHAFDFDELEEHRIVVRTAKEGEPFTTLDNKERSLDSYMLMICDGKKPVGIGGVMGGLNSEIKDSTTRVLLESAYFNPVSIRKTSKKLGLNTDASHRFERGADPEGTVKALDRAAQLMAELGGGRLVPGLIDEHPAPVPRREISLSVKDTNRLLGLQLNQNEVEDALKSVEFAVEKRDDDILSVRVPPFRVDVTRPVDLMEEVARLWGYNHIRTTFPAMPSHARQPAKPLILRNRIKECMNGFGFTEAITYSFMSKAACDHLRLGADDPGKNMLDILNPLTEDQAVMRTSLIPGILDTMRRNISQQVRNLKIFEIGKIFISSGQDRLPQEKEILAALWSGARVGTSWHSNDDECDFYDIKGVAESLLNALRVPNVKFTRMPPGSCTYSKPGYTAQILANNEYAGLVGEVHPDTLRSFDLRQTAFILELNLDRFCSLVSDAKQAVPIPKYPFVPRDITLIVKKDIEAAAILEMVANIGEPLMEELHLFAVYEGEPIPKGSKSVSFRIIYRSFQETLEDEKVNDIHKRITDKLLKAFDAALPA